MFNAAVSKTLSALKAFNAPAKVPRVNFSINTKETIQSIKTRPNSARQARQPIKIPNAGKSNIMESMKMSEVTNLRNIHPDHSLKTVDLSPFESKNNRNVPNNYVNLKEVKETNEKLSPSFDFDPDRVYNRKRFDLETMQHSFY